MMSLQPSLRDFPLFDHAYPTLKGWAILFHPSGRRQRNPSVIGHSGSQQSPTTLQAPERCRVSRTPRAGAATSVLRNFHALEKIVRDCVASSVTELREASWSAGDPAPLL